jgi:hypothetical protein
MAWEGYSKSLMKNVVSPFKGRVIILGYSPQHFRSSGEYVAENSYDSCCPLPLPDIPHTSSVRNSIWNMAILKHILPSKKGKITRNIEININLLNLTLTL